MKIVAVVISTRDKFYVNTTPKRNISACYYFNKEKIVDQKMKTKMNFISFLQQ